MTYITVSDGTKYTEKSAQALVCFAQTGEEELDTNNQIRNALLNRGDIIETSDGVCLTLAGKIRAKELEDLGLVTSLDLFAFLD